MQVATIKRVWRGSKVARNGNRSRFFCRASTTGPREWGEVASWTVVTARIWLREIKGKAEGGSVILGIRNKSMRGRQHRRD